METRKCLILWLTYRTPAAPLLACCLLIYTKKTKPFRGSTALCVNVSLSRSNIIMMICIQRRSCEAVSVQYRGATDGIQISLNWLTNSWTPYCGERTVLFWFDWISQNKMAVVFVMTQGESLTSSRAIMRPKIKWKLRVFRGKCFGCVFV